MKRVSEGGSVLSFVLVGIVLASLLVGGIYFVNQQNVKQPTPVSKKSDQQPAKEREKQNPPLAEPRKGEDSSKTPSSTPQTGTAHELPATGSQGAISSALVIGLLCGLSVSYLRSRRLTSLFDLR